MLPRYGEVAERSKAAVLKTVDRRRSGGSNPSLSAKSYPISIICRIFTLAVSPQSARIRTRYPLPIRTDTNPTPHVLHPPPAGRGLRGDRPPQETRDGASPPSRGVAPTGRPFKPDGDRETPGPPLAAHDRGRGGPPDRDRTIGCLRARARRAASWAIHRRPVSRHRAHARRQGRLVSRWAHTSPCLG